AVEGRVAAAHMEGQLPALGFGQDVQGDEGQAGVDLREGALDLLAGGEDGIAVVQRIVAIGTLHGQHGSRLHAGLALDLDVVGLARGRNVEEVEAAVFQVEITPDGGVLDILETGQEVTAVAKLPIAQVEEAARGEEGAGLVHQAVPAAAQVEVAHQHAASDHDLVPAAPCDRPGTMRNEEPVVDQPVVVTFENVHSRTSEGEDDAFLADRDFDVVSEAESGSARVRGSTDAA